MKYFSIIDTKIIFSFTFVSNPVMHECMAVLDGLFNKTIHTKGVYGLLPNGSYVNLLAGVRKLKDRNRYISNLYEYAKEAYIAQSTEEWIAVDTAAIEEFAACGLKPADVATMVAKVEALARAYDLDDPITYIDADGNPFASIDTYEPSYNSSSAQYPSRYNPLDLVVTYGVRKTIKIPYNQHLKVQYLTILYYERENIAPIYMEYVDPETDSVSWLLPAELEAMA